MNGLEISAWESANNEVYLYKVTKNEEWSFKKLENYFQFENDEAIIVVGKRRVRTYKMADPKTNQRHFVFISKCKQTDGHFVFHVFFREVILIDFLHNLEHVHF